jgi:hypothetical protein
LSDANPATVQRSNLKPKEAPLRRAEEKKSQTGNRKLAATQCEFYRPSRRAHHKQHCIIRSLLDEGELASIPSRMFWIKHSNAFSGSHCEEVLIRGYNALDGLLPV